MFSLRKSSKLETIQNQVDQILKSIYPHLSMGMGWTPTSVETALKVKIKNNLFDSKDTKCYKLRNVTIISFAVNCQKEGRCELLKKCFPGWESNHGPLAL